MPGMSNTGCPLRSVVGSGQAGIPWERMQRANFSRPVMICGAWAWDGWSNGAQARWAAWNRALLTPACCGVTLGTPPRRLGSGKFGTPCARMQWEKATAWEFAAWTVAGPAAGGRLPHAVDSSARPAAAISMRTGFMPEVLYPNGG